MPIGMARMSSARPAFSAATHASSIERELDRARDARPTAATVHGSAQPRKLMSRDLDIVRLQPQLGDAPAPQPAAQAAATRTVLLTGATGVLGRFQLLEWLERMAAVDGRVVCLVRGRDHTDAVARLQATFAGDG